MRRVSGDSRLALAAEQLYARFLIPNSDAVSRASGIARLKAVLDKRRRILGPEDPDTLASMAHLTTFLDKSEARQFARAARTTFQRGHGRRQDRARTPALWIATNELHSSFTGIPGLETREQYVQRYRPRRVALLREAIQAAAPRAVVFLGTSERDTWAQIAGMHFVEGPAGAAWAQMGATRLVMLTHPTAYGAKNAYFESVGRELSGKP